MGQSLLQSLAYLSHIGVFPVFLFGATVTTQYGVEKDIKMSLNETVEIKIN
jgi:cytochrome c-type biogenesis protein CcmF